jgi:hypothetical protein
MRISESMNRHAASIKAHVVARRSAAIPVPPWTKIHHISSTKSGNNDRSTISVPTSSLQSIHLTLALSAAKDNDKRQLHTEKLISPNMKNSKNTKLLL